MKKLLFIITVCALVCCCACAEGGDTDAGEKYPEADIITLSDQEILWNGAAAGEDPACAVYLSHDVIYYEDRDTYDSGNPYGEGEADERHSAEEAAATTVVNITQPGSYCLRGSLSAGQIRIDLGEEAATDPQAVVTLILDGAEISCGVAPAILFRSVYECDNGWSTETAGPDVDTSAAGANVIIADGSVNVINGSHVAKIYKDNADQKKLWKQDGAFYSYMSLNIGAEEAGDGVLTIIADNEGLDSELHLTVNGGVINIYAQDDGVNTNEDGVSVTAINGGDLHILGGLGAEGDGIDSNGWLVINGGTVIAMAHPAADAGLDSDMGSYINGGTVVALGSTMDWPESDSEQVTINLQFAARQDAGDAIVVEDTEGRIVFAYDPSEDQVASSNIRQYQGAVVSCPAFELEATYQLFLGGVLSGVQEAGFYEPATVTSYTDGVKQVYTGTDVRGMGGPMGGPMGAPMPGGFAGERPEAPPEGEMPQGGEMPPQPPDGEMPQAPPDGQAPQGQPPFDGMKPEGEPPQRPEGEMPPDGEMPEFEEGEIVDTGVASADFYMQDKVNGFSGIRAE